MLILETELKRVEAVAFSPCGRFVAAGGAGVELWSVDCERVWRVDWNFTTASGRSVSQYVRQIAFHHSGGLLFAIVPRVGLWQLRVRDAEQREFRPASFNYTQFACSMSEDQLLALSNVELSRWTEPPPKTNRGNRRASWECIQQPDVVFNGCAFQDEDNILTHEIVQGIPSFRIRSAESSEVINEFPCRFHQIDSLDVITTGDTPFVLARRGNRVLIWTFDYLHRPPRTLDNDTPKIFTDFAMHPGGRYLATASNDKVIKLWEFAGGSSEPVRSFDWHGGRMRSIAFSPDGLIAAAGGDSGQLILFDVDL
jgi:WD40 repeat protein